jgi:hypothetical protein
MLAISNLNRPHTRSVASRTRHEALPSSGVRQSQSFTLEPSVRLCRCLVSNLNSALAETFLAQIKGRWISKLEAVDIWAQSHCRTALVYAEWDEGPRR